MSKKFKEGFGIMSILTRFILLLHFVVAISGCATLEEMDSLDSPTATLEAGKSIYLLTGNLKNEFKPKFIPKLSHISVERAADKEWIVFTIPATDYEKIKAALQDELFIAGLKKQVEDPEIGHSFLAQIALDPGEYTLRHIHSRSTAFLTQGTFDTPIHKTLEVTTPGIYYLGRINAVVRQRKDNEFRAGSTVPLLDQSVVGASGGTFDVEISDQWEVDGPLFLGQFPALQEKTITKAVLSPWDRVVAQKYWEAH